MPARHKDAQHAAHVEQLQRKQRKSLGRQRMPIGSAGRGSWKWGKRGQALHPTQPRHFFSYAANFRYRFQIENLRNHILSENRFTNEIKSIF